MPSSLAARFARLLGPLSALALLLALLLTPLAGLAQEGDAGESAVAAAPPTRILEFLPLYQYKDAPQDAVNALYRALADLGVTEADVTITVLGLAPDKLAVQGTSDRVAMVRQLLGSIDPPPKPQPPAQQAKELIDSLTVRYLPPEQLWQEVDRVMFTFLDFRRFDPGDANLVVYARGDGKTNRMDFYVPNPDLVAEQFARRTQGYQGYTIFVKATEIETELIATLKRILATLDQPLRSKRYEVVGIHYTEVEEALKSLRAAGYNAVVTSTGDLEAELLTQIQNGLSPVIYSAPNVQQDTAAVSTTFGSGSGGTGGTFSRSQFDILTFDNPVASSDIHRLIVYGSEEEINGVKEYIKLIDVPAKQMVIEAQIVEINVDALSDLGLRNITGADDILAGSINPRFPGEGGGSSSPTSTDTATFFTYDDASQPAGSFRAQLAALILEGKATVKARPKVVTVDGRQAIISIVRQVPVAQETINPNSDRSTFDISYIPVGITLNLKPRVGENDSEVQMQVNAVVSNVETINNVVSGLNLQAPELSTREVSTFVRVPNHRSLVLGGLINTETEERVFKTPILGDIPLIGNLFRRKRRNEDRTEIMIIITPHIVQEDRFESTGPVDLYTTPKATSAFDSLGSLLSNSSYLLKIEDIRGIHPETREPLAYEGEDPPLGAPEDPVFLTVAGIVRELNLVEELGVVKQLEFPADWTGARTPFELRRIAHAFLIGYIIESNKLHIPDLLPGRELIVPYKSETFLAEGIESNPWRTVDWGLLAEGGMYHRLVESLRGLEYAEEQVEEEE